MPIAKIQLPDGRIAKFEVAEGTTPEEVEQYAQTEFAEQPSQDITKAESFVTGAGQGVSFGFGEEMVAGLATPAIYAGSKVAEGLGYDTRGLADKSMSDIYKEEVRKSRKEMDSAKQANPKTFLGGEVAGSISSGVGLGKTIPNITKGGFLSRTGKAIATGAATSGIYGAGTAQEGERLEAAEDAAKAGALLSAFLPAAASLTKATKTGVEAGVKKIASKIPLLKNNGQLITRKETIKTAEDLKELANNAYKRAESKGGILKSSFTDKFINKAQQAKPQTAAGKILSGDNVASKVADKLQELKGRKLNLSEVQEIDEFLSEAIDSQVNVLGSVNKQGKKLIDIQSELRSMVEKAPINQIAGDKQGFQALKEARELWAKSMRLRDIQRILEKAESMDNPATAIKTGFRTLANNPKKLRGYSAQEKKLIKQAAKSGLTTDALRVAGSRLIPIGAMVSGGGLATLSSAQLGTTLSRNLATKAQQKRALRVADEILGNTPQQKPVTGQMSLAPAGVSPVATELTQ